MNQTFAILLIAFFTLLPSAYGQVDLLGNSAKEQILSQKGGKSMRLLSYRYAGKARKKRSAIVIKNPANKDGVLVREQIELMQHTLNSSRPVFIEPVLAKAIGKTYTLRYSTEKKYFAQNGMLTFAGIRHVQGALFHGYKVFIDGQR